MALTKEKLQEILDAGGITLADILYAAGGVDAKAAMDARTEMKLLWTNPSPTSDFADGTQALTLTDYDAVEVDFQANTGSASIFGNARCNKGKSCVLNCVGTKIYRRDMSVDASGITWGSGQVVNTYGGAASNGNANIIPVRIYGIRGMQ